MASYSLNNAAVAHARRLIDARQYVLDSDWGEVQPRRRGRERVPGVALLGRVRRVAPRAHRGRGRRDQGALRLRLRRLPARPPDRAHRVRLPGVRVAPQGGRARRPRPAAAPRRDVGIIRTFLDFAVKPGHAEALAAEFERLAILDTSVAQPGCTSAEMSVSADGTTVAGDGDIRSPRPTRRGRREVIAVRWPTSSTSTSPALDAATVGRVHTVLLRKEASKPD